MSNHTNSSGLDNELAEMTDKLIAAQPTEVTADNAMSAKIVAQLYAVVTSGHGPETTFRNELTRRLNDEWDQVFQHKRARLMDRRFVRFGALAAAVVVVLGITLAVLPNDAVGGLINGTAFGSAEAGIIAILAVGVAIAVAVVLWRRH